MRRPDLRVTHPGEAVSVEMAEAIERVMRECIAARPTTVFIAWECSDAGNKVIECRSVPDSIPLRRGMIIGLYEDLYPQAVE